MSFGDVFVLQSAASNLLQLKERVQRGLQHAGPALFSIYAAPDGGAVPGYLQAAAAMQSRAFPAFSYDPGAGPDLASRFSLENNPQPELDWPLERLEYADPDLQAVSEEVAFTFADFAACDARCADHFEPAPRAAWGEGMIPADQWIAKASPDPSGSVPYVLAVDDGDLLCRLVVDERLMRAALRCREDWHRLQEFGGIHDSRAERLLARERQAWEETRQRELAAAAAVSTGCCDGQCGGGGRCNDRARAGCRRTGRSRGRAGAQPGRGLHRDDPLLELQRVHAGEPAHVRLRRQQAGLHRRSQGGHVQAARRGCRELPVVDHPSGQAVGSGRTGPRGTARAREAVHLSHSAIRSNAVTVSGQ